MRFSSFLLTFHVVIAAPTGSVPTTTPSSGTAELLEAASLLTSNVSTDLPADSVDVRDIKDGGVSSNPAIPPRFDWGWGESLINEGIKKVLGLFGDNAAVQYFSSLKDKGFELVKSMVLRCGKNVAAGKLPTLIAQAMESLWEKPGPWDAVLCDAFTGALNKDPSQIQSFGLKQCNEAANEDPEFSYRKCAKQNMYEGDKFELTKALFKAATGVGEVEESATIATMTDVYKDCTSNGGDMQQCLTLSFVRGTCKGICGTSDCLIEEYKAVEDEQCQDALDVSCSAMYHASYAACKQLASLLPEDIRQQALGFTECTPTCRSAGRGYLPKVMGAFAMAVAVGTFI